MKIPLQYIFSGRRNIDLEIRIDTTNFSRAFVECTFFRPEYTCTIDYGTDSSSTNPVYRDISSTLGRSTTILVSQELRGDTTYYYNVSAESNSQCVRVLGRFRTGRYHACIYINFRVNRWKWYSSPNPTTRFDRYRYLWFHHQMQLFSLYGRILYWKKIFVGNHWQILHFSWISDTQAGTRFLSGCPCGDKTCKKLKYYLKCRRYPSCCNGRGFFLCRQRPTRAQHTPVTSGSGQSRI